MSISQEPTAEPAPTRTADSQLQENHQVKSDSVSRNGTLKDPGATTPPATVESAGPKESLDTSSISNNVDPPADFEGDVDTNNALPTQAVLRKVQDVMLFNEEGVAVPFRSLYTGPNVARRVLVIFVRHFFCGNCQEYLRTLSASITPSELLALPVPTFIVVVGCGSHSLIKMYQEATSCPFPIYADPTRELYSELGMVQTLALGPRPEYVRKSLLKVVLSSIAQELRQFKSGKALQGGDPRQVGGEFLFEPINDPALTPQLPNAKEATSKGQPAGPLEEEKRVVWCHRMRNTRDHAEIPEIRELLGLDGTGQPRGRNSSRWSRAVGTRKGSGLSAGSRKSTAEQQPAAAVSGAGTNVETAATGGS